MAIYKISPAAQSDLVDIYMRGIQNQGMTNANNYQLQLERFPGSIVIRSL